MDAAARREIRRKKILENAEQRRQKILGIKDSDASSTGNYAPEPMIDGLSLCPAADSSKNEDLSTYGYDSPLSKTVHYNELHDSNSLNEHPSESLGINYETPISRNSSNNNINRSPLLINKSNYQSNEKSKNFLSILIDFPLTPCLLALFVSALICSGYGYIVSENFILPFVLWELHHVVSFSNANVESKNSLLATIVLLCGINTEPLWKYFWLFKTFMKLIDDFVLYIGCVILWQVIIGLRVG